MKEEGGGDDTGHREEEHDKDIDSLIKTKVGQSHPAHITYCVDPSKCLTEFDSRVSIKEIDFTEVKVGNRGEDNEGGMSVEDLERGFISEVQSREEGEEELGKK